MTRNSSSLSLAYANPRPNPRLALRAATPVRAAGKAPPQRRPHVGARPGVIVATVIVAIVWLLLGCSGLIWTIAFTQGPRPLALALAVWVLAFVGPSMLATVVAYRLEELTLASGSEAD